MKWKRKGMVSMRKLWLVAKIYAKWREAKKGIFNMTQHRPAWKRRKFAFSRLIEEVIWERSEHCRL